MPLALNEKGFRSQVAMDGKEALTPARHPAIKVDAAAVPDKWMVDLIRR